ncbi:MAG: hypothetical protein J7K23_03730 [Thermoproteales archaeon]|nr:hypothetical protein [Thermoproteales archaeon]
MVIREKARGINLEYEPVIEANAALVDYDLWLIDSVIEYGFEGFVKRLEDRVDGSGERFLRYLYALYLIVLSMDLALLSDMPYRMDTLRVLVEWCSRYADEVEDYLDTFLFLVSDYSYETLAGFIKS